MSGDPRLGSPEGEPEEQNRWVPHPDANARRASAIRLAQVVLEAEGLTDAHRRSTLSQAIWFFTEADGKYNTRYRSRDALDADPTNLNHEHVVPRKVLVDRLLACPEECEQTMRSAVACCVLRIEHARLKNVERSNPSLDGWARYAAAEIPVVDLLTGWEIDLDSNPLSPR